MDKKRVILNLRIAITNKNYSALINDYRVGGMKWNDVGSERNSLFYKIGLNKEDLLFALGVKKQLTDLEAKLAESEKALEYARYPVARILDDINQLKQQIIEECKEHQEFCKVADEKVKSLQNNWNILCDYLGECIVKYDSEDCNGIYSEILSKVNEIKKYSAKQSQNQTAIAELEKVKEYMEKKLVEFDNTEMKIIMGLYAFNIENQINQQIKSLKGDK